MTRLLSRVGGGFVRVLPLTALVIAASLVGISGAAASGGACSSSASSPYGDGRDGTVTVHSGTTTYTDDIRMDLGADAPAMATTVMVAPGSSLFGLAPGDQVLLIQITATAPASTSAPRSSP